MCELWHRSRYQMYTHRCKIFCNRASHVQIIHTGIAFSYYSHGPHYFHPQPFWFKQSWFVYRLNREGDAPWSDFRLDDKAVPACRFHRKGSVYTIVAVTRCHLLHTDDRLDACQVPWYRSVFFGICTRTHDDVPDGRNSFFVHRCTVYYVSPYSTVY